MAHYSYNDIEPLIYRETREGRNLLLAFRCPVSGETVASQASMVASRTQGVVNRTRQSMQTQAAWSLQQSLGRWVSQLLGGGYAGNLGRQMFEQGARRAVPAGARGSTAGQPLFNEADRRKAIELAFSKVADRFAWDAQGGRWVAVKATAQLESEFAAVMGEAALGAADRKVLARMLTEIAAADGEMAKEERDLYAVFSDGMGGMDALMRMPKLSADELAETDPAAREAMLLLAVAMAWSDEDLDPAEVARLDALRSGLAVSKSRFAELERIAKEYLIDQLLDAAGRDEEVSAVLREAISERAAAFGISGADLERLEARCRARQGA